VEDISAGAAGNLSTDYDGLSVIWSSWPLRRGGTVVYWTVIVCRAKGPMPGLKRPGATNNEQAAAVRRDQRVKFGGGRVVVAVSAKNSLSAK